MSLQVTLTQILTQPTTEALWRFRGQLLTLAEHLPEPGRQEASWTFEIVAQFYHYLAEVQSKLTAREYSRLASRLDMGSVGLLAVQDLVAERDHLMESLFLGGLSEGLMVLATLQYVKAWGAELLLAHSRAVWWLYEGLWRLSATYRPDMPAAARQQLIHNLLALARAEDTKPLLKMALLVRLFQVLLIGSLGWTASLKLEGGEEG